MGLDPPSHALVEGDYIETEEGLLFTVKGLSHPKEGVIAFLRYLPDDVGERRRGSQRYKRIYDFDEATEILRRKTPQFVRHTEQMGLTLQIVPWDKISRVYKPQERLQSLIESPKTNLERSVVRFASILSSESGVSLENFGVSGSVLIGLATSKSDIDIVVYGGGEGKLAYKALDELRGKGGDISLYDETTVENILKSRWGDTDLDPINLRKIEIKKILHGLFGGTDYFVRLVKRPKEVELEIASRPFCKVRLRAVISQASESIFTPCTYSVRNCHFLDTDFQTEVSELLSFRGKFTEMAREGDEVEAQGTLEEVMYQSRTIHRVVLGGKGDYLVPVRLLKR